MADEERSWRPRSGHDVVLSDRDLAKLGLLAQLEAQCKWGVTIAIKGVKGLSTPEWLRLEQTPFEQLAKSLLDISEPLDEELHKLAVRIDTEQAGILVRRHQNLHALWGVDSSGLPQGWDAKRNQQLKSAELDAALEAVAALSWVTRAAAFRVGELIAEGLLPERRGRTGPRIAVNGRVIKL